MVKYKVAKYIRLSDDDRTDRESMSVENQRDLLNYYIDNHDDLQSYSEYVDDGYTGANFDRPSFKRMIKDIEDGKINCIITKDLSRFGRDHIDTGYYLERYLPKKDIRFIAIGDNVDTIDAKGLQFLSFKLSFNDYYIQDISNKIKSVKRKKMENGEYIAGIPPYGYKKDSEIKNHLIIDEEVAENVRQIFYMFVCKKMTMVKIAEYLNEKEIEPPSVYLKMGCTKKAPKNPTGKYLWTRTEIRHILKNQAYIGDVVNGKREQVSPKLKKGRKKEQEEYIVVKNMHEPIIDLFTWNRAQKKLREYSNDKYLKYEYPLKNLVYCAECGQKVTFNHFRAKRKDGTYREHNFGTCIRKEYKDACPNTGINENILMNAVKHALDDELKKIEIKNSELKDMYMKLSKSNQQGKNKNNIKTKENKIQEINENMSVLLKKKYSREITPAEFKKSYDSLFLKREKLKQELEELNQNDANKNNEQIKENKKMKQAIKNAKKLFDVNNLSNEMLSRFIKRIEYDKDKNISIYFNFRST